MLKRTIFTILFIALLLSGCSNQPTAEARVLRFGPNYADDSYYLYTKGVDDYHTLSKLYMYSIDEHSERKIFDIGNSDGRILSYRLKDGLISFLVQYKDSYQGYEYNIDTEVLSSFDYDPETPIDDWNDSGTQAYIDTLDYGTVTFCKDVNDNTYWCTIEGVKTPVKAISDKVFSDAGIYSDDLIYIDGCIIGRVTALEGIGHGPQGIPSANDAYNSQIKKDILFSLNLETKESVVLYDTKSNNERIVGYKNNCVYLYSKYKLSMLNLDTNEKTILQSFDDNDRITFSWFGNNLLVFDDIKEEVVFVLKQ